MNPDWQTSESFEKGIATRRAVLGDEYVEWALTGVDDFTRPIQEYATEVCWDRIWNREGLSRRDRSILNLGMITSLNRQHELKAHVRGALNNGLTKEELGEIFLQSAIYCGLPAALDSYRTAREVFKEMGIE
jgi:4-carboxymuconolactone decarboxylase